MKKKTILYYSSFFILFLLLSILQLQCRKQDRGFQMTYLTKPNDQFNVSIGLDPFASHFFVVNNIATDTSLFFSSNNLTAKQLGRITPYTMNIRAVYQDGAYDYVSSVEVSISDPTRPNLPAQIIFYNDNVPVSTGTQIILIPNDVDVTPFLIQGKSFSITTRLRLRDVPQRTITTGWNMSFFARY